MLRSASELSFSSHLQIKRASSWTNGSSLNFASFSFCFRPSIVTKIHRSLLHAEDPREVHPYRSHLLVCNCHSCSSQHSSSPRRYLQACVRRGERCRKRGIAKGSCRREIRYNTILCHLRYLRPNALASTQADCRQEVSGCEGRHGNVGNIEACSGRRTIFRHCR